jgi:polysaccharide pyruvyl transferase WcaK-like protein
MDLSDVRFEDFHLVLVGGGGTIDGKPYRRKSGMAFPLSGEQIRGQRIPLCYVALGYNLFQGEQLHCRNALADVLRACVDLDIPFSVRNDGSLNRLQEAVGDAADQVVEVPDPGFFVPVAEDRVPRMDSSRPTVLLQIAGDNLTRRLGAVATKRWFGKRSGNAVGELARQAAELVTWLVEQCDVDVVLAPHISKDLAVTAAVFDYLKPAIARYRVRSLGIVSARQAPLFFAAYQQADLVIGMRGHSVICAVGLDRPCIALSTHDKVRGFMENCGLNAWTVDYGRDWVEQTKRQTLSLLSEPARYHVARQAGTRDFAARFDSFLAKCRDRWLPDFAQPPAADAAVRRPA